MKKIFLRNGFLLTLILICKSIHGQPISFVNLISPAPIEQGGITVVMQLEFLNNSGSTLTSANFNYSLNGGSPNVLPWTGNLSAGNSDTVIFSPLSIPNGQYSLCFWTTTPSSDTICYTYVGSNAIITPPFADNFESPSDWASSLSIPNYLSGWQLGTPNYGVVNTPHSGVKSWVIGLDSGYENSMLAYLYSPYFNFSNGSSLKIAFWQNRNTHVARDGAWLEYTLDSGLTWSVLGIVNDPNATNWYPNTLYSTTNQLAWDSASNGWRESIYNWQLGSWPVVQLRFGFYSDPLGNAWDGIAIDDFTIDSCHLSLSIASLQNVSCFGANDGEICVNVTGGTSPYVYSWSNGTTAQCVQNLSGGIYSITVMDAHACSASISATVTEPAPLIIDSISTVSATCATSNGSACVYVSGGTTPYSYLWINSNTTQCISGLSAGAYTVLVTDINGCTNTSQAFVNSSSSIFITPDSVNNVSCNGGTNGNIYISVGGGTPLYSYMWSNTATTQDLTNLIAGTYTVTVTDANNCTAFSSYTLTEPPLLMLTNPSSTTICTGTGLCAVPAGGTSPYTYLWSTTETTQCLSSPSGGSYTVTITDANNCSVSGSINLTIDPPIQITLFGDLYICSGDSASVFLSVNGGTVPYNYLWSDGSFGTLYTMIPGTYTITVTDIAGCSAQDSINIHCDGVWPGDANYDGTANNLDLLPIGIGYGTTGPIRPGASLIWIAQPSPAWTDTLSGTINYKHIDCNGDGIINDADTVAIIQNYGQTHPLRLLATVQNLLDPYLYFDIVVDTAGTSQQIDVPLMFGTSTVPADSIYGLAFTVNYDTSLVKADSVGIDFTTSWIGTMGTDMITIQHNDPVNGQLHVGMTRIDHNNISGFGEIAKVSVVTVDNVSGKMSSLSVFDTLTFTLSDVTIIDKDENIRNVNLGGDSLIIQDSTTTISEISFPEKIKIYPNPAKDKMFIEIPSGYSINEISITNIVGEKIIGESIIKQNVVEIKNLQNFSNGIYFLKIKTDDGSGIKKFSVIH